MAIKDALLAEFDHEMGTTRRLLERMPDERLDWKPHEKSMSLGGLATHLANLPNWGTTILDDPSFDLAAAPPNHDSEGIARRSPVGFRRRHQERARERWTRPTPSISRTGRSSAANRKCSRCRAPRRSAPSSSITSSIIAGQLSVYLRLNDVPVPAIYGPSADEG